MTVTSKNKGSSAVSRTIQQTKMITTDRNSPPSLDQWRDILLHLTVLSQLQLRLHFGSDLFQGVTMVRYLSNVEKKETTGKFFYFISNTTNTTTSTVLITQSLNTITIPMTFISFKVTSVIMMTINLQTKPLITKTILVQHYV